MSRLEQLQTTFQAHLLDPTTKLTSIAPAHRGDSETRLKVYTEGYRLRLMEVIEDDFEITKQFLGQARFQALASEFIETHPSSHFTLNVYAEDFAAYIADAGEAAAAELASFEWAMAMAQIARQETPLTISHLESTAPGAWPELTFKLQPNIQRLRFQHYITGLWQALSKDEKFELSDNEPEDVIVWQCKCDPYFMSLDPRQVIMFDAIKRGASFAAICAALSDALPEDAVPQFAAGQLHAWVSQEVLTSQNIS